MNRALFVLTGCLVASIVLNFNIGYKHYNTCYALQTELNQSRDDWMKTYRDSCQEGNCLQKLQEMSEKINKDIEAYLEKVGCPKNNI